MATEEPNLSRIRSIDDLLIYLEEKLSWPIAEMAIDDLTFEYDPSDDLGLSPAAAAAVRRILQIRSLTIEQPFGIFFIEFEPRYLPLGIMRRILTALVTRRKAASNPTTRKTWAQEDLLFLSASGDDGGRRIDFAYFTQPSNRSVPTVHLLGWDIGEPAAKLEWVDQQLRASLGWPEAANPDIWRTQWAQAFKTRPARQRGAWADMDTAQRQALIELYAAAELTVDALPYTADFDWLHDAYNRSTGLKLTHHDFWRALSSARKTGMLARKQR